MRISAQPTSLEGVQLISAHPFHDSRGHFARIFCRQTLKKLADFGELHQVNHSYNKHRGTLRGLHFQRAPFTEHKIVFCLFGEVHDVVVDIRLGSKTYGQSIAFELNAQKQTGVLIPPGCAHGFQTLTDNAELIYLHDAEYVADASGGINAFDEALKIEWPLTVSEISERDQQLPCLADLTNQVGKSNEM